MKRFFILFAIVLVSSDWCWAQRNLKDIPSPDPSIELASFKVADGFEVNLWAADPLLSKPTQISFDRHGRLWVSSSQTYPQLNVNQEPNDRIVILEDTDRDGVADKSSVFYDKLVIPGGVLPDGQGGAYVAHAEQLLHLEDTTQDGKADKRSVLLSGFGTEDTHHTLHRLRWGPGGKMFMLQGYYIGSHVETLYGPRRLNGGGLWSYDTKTRRLEIYSRGLTNPWGIRFDKWGQSFQTDGAGGEGINYSFPDAVFCSSPNENRKLRGLNPGRPKSCGLEIISGNHFPEAWQGRLLTNDFRANNIDCYTLEENGSGYNSTLQEDLLQSSHVSFRPIDIVMGPDGAIYVADWYSPIIQHGEVDFRDKRRDQVHGRIWRITAKGRPLEERIAYTQHSVPELIELLKSDAAWVRTNAKQELKLRDEIEVQEALLRWLEELDRKDPESERHQLEALWAYQTTSTKRSPAFALMMFDSPNHRVRAAAARVLYDWHVSPDALADVISDPHPQVRREVVTALGQLGSLKAAELALSVLDHPMDEYLDFALWRTCRLLEPHWMPAVLNADANGKLPFGGNSDRLAFALKAVEKRNAIEPLIKILQQNDRDADPAIIRLIGKLGTKEQLATLRTISTTANHPLLEATALALQESAELRGMKPFNPEDTVASCREFLQSTDEQTQVAACRLVGLWDVKGYRGLLAGRLTGKNSTAEVRSAAALGLADLNETKMLQAIAQEEGLKAEIRVAATSALIKADVGMGANATALLLATPLNSNQVDVLITRIMNKRLGASRLINLLKDSSIPSGTAIYASRMVETFDAPSRDELLRALATAGELPAPKELSAEELDAMVAKVDGGNPKRGKRVFERATLTCVKCHAVDGKGQNIGPDLSSIGTAAPVDYLIESILSPSKKIKEGYRMAVIITDDGDAISGAVLREDDTSVVVRNAAGRTTTVPVRNIDERSTSAVSMMPSGLTASLREDEFVDLIAYLRSLGRN